MTERAWQAMVLQAASYLAWSCYHTFDSRRSAPGFPDAICVREGRMLALEFKTARGRPSPAQEAWIAALDAVPGVTARIVRPDDWEAVLAMLQGEAAWD